MNEIFSENIQASFIFAQTADICSQVNLLVKSAVGEQTDY